jgi:hypothetical protein
MGPRNLRAFAVAGLVVVASLLVLQGVYIVDKGKLHPDATSLTLLVIAAAFIAATIAPEAALATLRKFESVEAFGVKVALSIERAERAIVDLPDESDDGVRTSERPNTGDVEGDLEAVAEVMRKRLRFVRDALLHDPSNLGESVMVVRLAELGLLNEDEVDLITFVLKDGRKELPEWKAEERERLLDYAWQLGTRLATTVFDRYVRARLRDNGWFICDYDQPRGHRPDFLGANASTWAVLAARVGAPARTVDATRKRLASTQIPAGVMGRAVVIPDRDEGAQELLEGPVVVVKLEHLIGHPQLVGGLQTLLDDA